MPRIKIIPICARCLSCFLVDDKVLDLLLWRDFKVLDPLLWYDFNLILPELVLPELVLLIANLDLDADDNSGEILV